MVYEKTQDTEEIGKRIIHYMVNKLEEKGLSSNQYYFDFEPEGLYSTDKNEALEFVQCSEEDFYKGLTVCIDRRCVVRRTLDFNYAMLALNY